jgi:TRAP-type C4-dicarboxylate transport system permease small subunit
LISFFEKQVDRLAKFELVLSAIVAFSLGILVFVSASMRYVFGSPLMFSDELAALMFVVASFLCLPYTTRRGMNIKLDVLTKRFSEKTQAIMGVVALIVGCIIISAFATSAIDEVPFSIEMKEVSEMAEIMVYPFKIIVIFCLYSMVLAMITNLLCGTTNGNK